MSSIVAGMQEYVQAIIDRISGMKVMILDSETVGIISMVFSQSEILEHEVFLVGRIESDEHERMRHLNAIYLLRPTKQNFLLLAKELKEPKYQEYHIFFTNVVPHTRLEQLACCDEFDVVHQVQEFFADVYAVGHELFSLNLPSTILLTEDRSRWSSYEESVFDRTVEGLLAACLTLRMMPAIRYTSSSELTRQVAIRLQSHIAEAKCLFESMEQDSRRGEAPPTVLLLDRRDDPVTPLLNQFTYQAMLHELLTMNNNRIDMSKVPDVRKEHQEIVMSTTHDSFFEESALLNWGDLCGRIKDYVEEYQTKTKSTRKIESIEDMQKFVDEYPEFRRMSGNVSKHVAVVHELSRIVDANGLLQATLLEQELACTENRQEHYRAVVEMIKGSSITNMERLRLVLLYALRYEHDTTNRQLKELLHNKGIGAEQIELIEQVLRYGGSDVRGGDLFQNKSFLEKAKSAVTRGLKGVENVYTQHKTLVGTTADSLMRGKLKEDRFPVVNGARYTASAREPASRAIIFVVGGACFEEARDVSEVNRSLDAGRIVILGGTTIHNSRSFLADVSQINVRGINE